MPYHRWLETSRRHGDRPAIFDGAGVVTFADLSDAVKAAPPATSAVVARSGGVGFFVEILRAWRDGQAVIPVERDAPDPVLHGLPPPGTCLVKHTPGAAGIPRGIFFNGPQIEADCDRIANAMGLNPATPNLAAIPLAHSYGFSNVVLPLLFHGVPVHLAALPFPRVIAEIFKCHPSLVVPAVPSIWRAWHRAGILRNAPISLAVSAGSPLSLELEMTVLADAGLKIHNFYGASECGGISFDSSETLRESADDVGSPLPGVEVSINGEGRILIGGDGVATGYDTPRPADVLGNGRHLTRDLGRIGPGGRIHLTGTLGGAINVAGRKVSPARIETAILATGLVRRVRVHGIPSNDPERHEEIAAEVELMDGVSIGTLKTEVSSSLQSWELPRHWIT